MPSILGAHLEGPYLSPEQSGSPGPALSAAAGPAGVPGPAGALRLHPPLDRGPGAARAAWPWAATWPRRGIVASIGHSNAGYEEVLAAFRSGYLPGHAPVQRHVAPGAQERLDAPRGGRERPGHRRPGGGDHRRREAPAGPAAGADLQGKGTAGHLPDHGFHARGRTGGEGEHPRQPERRPAGAHRGRGGLHARPGELRAAASPPPTDWCAPWSQQAGVPLAEAVRMLTPYAGAGHGHRRAQGQPGARQGRRPGGLRRAHPRSAWSWWKARSGWTRSDRGACGAGVPGLAPRGAIRAMPKRGRIPTHPDRPGAGPPAGAPAPGQPAGRRRGPGKRAQPAQLRHPRGSGPALRRQGRRTCIDTLAVKDRGLLRAPAGGEPLGQGHVRRLRGPGHPGDGHADVHPPRVRPRALRRACWGGPAPSAKLLDPGSDRAGQVQVPEGQLAEAAPACRSSWSTRPATCCRCWRLADRLLAEMVERGLLYRFLSANARVQEKTRARDPYQGYRGCRSSGAFPRSRSGRSPCCGAPGKSTRSCTTCRRTTWPRTTCWPASPVPPRPTPGRWPKPWDGADRGCGSTSRSWPRLIRQAGRRGRSPLEQGRRGGGDRPVEGPGA